mmetsp:Transcript_11112/g.27130  ORF Transcript_11112/g.27130 Transcript_11112/m.27130 type:complete len:232 (-) Transcript_11112:314-1009(-)
MHPWSYLGPALRPRGFTREPPPERERPPLPRPPPPPPPPPRFLPDRFPSLFPVPRAGSKRSSCLSTRCSRPSASTSATGALRAAAAHNTATSPTVAVSPCKHTGGGPITSPTVLPAAAAVAKAIASVPVPSARPPPPPPPSRLESTRRASDVGDAAAEEEPRRVPTGRKFRSMTTATKPHPTALAAATAGSSSRTTNRYASRLFTGEELQPPPASSSAASVASTSSSSALP